MGNLNFVGNQESFKQRSNRRKETKQLWCKNHITGLWFEGYDQCATGFRKKEPCVRGKDD